MLIEVINRGRVVFTDHITDYFSKKDELRKQYLAEEFRFWEERNGILEFRGKEFPNVAWKDLTEEQRDEIDEWVGDYLLEKYRLMRYAQDCVCTIHDGAIRVSVNAGRDVGSVFCFVPSWSMAMKIVRRLLQEETVDGWLTITLAANGHIIETWKQFYHYYPNTYWEPADCDYDLYVYRHPQADKIVKDYREYDYDEMTPDAIY